MGNGDHMAAQEPDGQVALFPIVQTIIFDSECWACKNLRRIHEVDTVLTQVRASL